MELVNVLNAGEDYRKSFYELYESAFPLEEKKPIDMMERLARVGKMELLAVSDEESVIGLAIHMLGKKSVLLDYFAILPEKRSGGYGTKILQMLTERFGKKKYILEIEMLDEEADNAVQRKRRKEFYLKNGIKETGVFVNVYETDFELLTVDGKLKYEEYVQLLRDVLGEEGLRVLRPRKL